MDSTKQGRKKGWVGKTSYFLALYNYAMRQYLEDGRPTRYDEECRSNTRMDISNYPIDAFYRHSRY